MRIDKSEVLAITNQGLDVFAHFLPEAAAIRGYRAINLCSPFRADSDSDGCSIYFNKKHGKWCFHDFITGEDFDCFSFVQRYRGCEFREAVEICNQIGGGVNVDNSATFVKAPAREKLKVRRVWPGWEAGQNRLEGTTALHEWMGGLGVSAEHMRMWGLGHYRAKNGPQHTAFLYIDADGRLCTWKCVQYNADGRRIKMDAEGNKLFPWFAKPWPRERDGEELEYGKCLFGSHLLDPAKGRSVCLVESEKTAILAAYFYPAYDWVATGGATGCQDEHFEVLRDRRIYVFCDADPAGRKPKAAFRLRGLGMECTIVDLWPQKGLLLDDPERGFDLADGIAQGERPTLFTTGKHGQIEVNEKGEDEVKWIGVWEHQIDKETGEIIEHLKPLLDLKWPSPPAKKAAKAGQDDEQGYDWLSIIPEEAYEEEGNDPESDMNKYGFFEWKNQYWVPAKSGNGWRRQAISNFVCRYLFHMETGKRTLRIVELRNNRGVIKTIETETGNLVSVGEFMKFVEGAGNFRFEGGRAEHQKIKAKLMEQEEYCQQLDVLGWNAAGFFAFANGLYLPQKGAGKDTRTGFLEADTRGIVSLGSKSYYLPVANATYLNNPALFNNERKVRYVETGVSWETWVSLYHRVYGEPGMVAMLFGMACAFSDVVFSAQQFFPMLFFYGEGGSGKGVLIRSTQHLFGKPQDPLHLSSDANTDKAKIRELAQFRNLICCLEEYRNGNDKTVNMLKGIWDRFGYKRASMDTSYRTETVPIQSGVMITGNDYPTDDPLLQRLIVLELNKNQRTEEDKFKFQELKELQETGMTDILCQLLEERPLIEADFNTTFRECSRDMGKLFAGVSLTDRMISNVAVLDAMYVLLSPRFPMPFNREELHAYLRESMTRQNAKRDTGGDVAKFWDTIMYCIGKGEITDGGEIRVDGDTISVRFTEVHMKYKAAFRFVHGGQGLERMSMLDKLRGTKAYKGAKATARFANGARSSCHLFDLSQIEADILGAIAISKGDGSSGHPSTINEPVEEEALPF